jgi:hypothetical protein
MQIQRPQNGPMRWKVQLQSVTPVCRLYSLQIEFCLHTFRRWTIFVNNGENEKGEQSKSRGKKAIMWWPNKKHLHDKLRGRACSTGALSEWYKEFGLCSENHPSAAYRIVSQVTMRHPIGNRWWLWLLSTGCKRKAVTSASETDCVSGTNGAAKDRVVVSVKHDSKIGIDWMSLFGSVLARTRPYVDVGAIIAVLDWICKTCVQTKHVLRIYHINARYWNKYRRFWRVL